MNQILAIALHTIRQGLRRKTTLALLGFAAVLVLCGQFLPVVETRSAKVSLLSSFTLTTTAFFASILAILLVSTLLPDDIRSKRIHTVLTKPVHRFQLLLGIFFGTLTLTAVALLLMGGLGLAIIYGVARGEDLAVDRAVRATQRTTEGNGVRTEGDAVWLTGDKENRVRYIFEGISTDLFPGARVQGRLTIFLAAPERLKGYMKIQPVRVTISDPGGGQSHETPLTMSWEKSMRFDFPKDLVKRWGTTVTIERIDKRYTVGIRRDALFLVSPTGSFLLNYVKALGITFFKILVLVAVGVMGSSVFSGPVAALVAFFVYFASHLTDFLMEMGQTLAIPLIQVARNIAAHPERYRLHGNPELGHSHHLPDLHGLPEEFLHRILTQGLTPDIEKEIEALGAPVHEVLIKKILALFYFLIPNFNRYGGSEGVVDRVQIPWEALTGAVQFYSIYIIGAILIAMVFFQKKELDA